MTTTTQQWTPTTGTADERADATGRKEARARHAEFRKHLHAQREAILDSLPPDKRLDQRIRWAEEDMENETPAKNETRAQ